MTTTDDHRTIADYWAAYIAGDDDALGIADYVTARRRIAEYDELLERHLRLRAQHDALVAQLATTRKAIYAAAEHGNITRVRDLCADHDIWP